MNEYGGIVGVCGPRVSAVPVDIPVPAGTVPGANAVQTVVNMYLQHWRVPNLFVLGASAFPQIPSGNLPFTGAALAYCIAGMA